MIGKGSYPAIRVNGYFHPFQLCAAVFGSTEKGF
jgi:hypothetical protein